MPDGHRRQRVLQVVPPRHLQRQRRRATCRRSARRSSDRRAAASYHASRDTDSGTEHRRRSAGRCSRRQPTRGRRSITRRVIRGRTAARCSIVGARDDAAVERHLVGEVDERLLQVVEAAVVLEVLVVDVRNHRNRRKQFQKRPVALVRLRHHELAASEPRVAAEGAQPPADHRRRIEPGALEHQRDHRRRRRLAVRAGDRDREAQPHQLRQHLGARNHRNLPPRRLRRPPGSTASPPTRSPRRRRRRRAPPRARSRTAMPSVCEPIGHRRPLLVRTAHDVAEIREQLGDAAHADAADADEVHAPRLTEHDALPRSSASAAIDDHASRRRGRASDSAPPRPSCAALAIARPAPAIALRQHARRSASRCSSTSARAAPRRALPRSCAGDRRSRSAAASESPPSRGRDLRQRRRAGATDDQVGRSELAVPCRRGTARRRPEARPADSAARTISTSRSPVWCVRRRRGPPAASRGAASTMATLIACAP